MTDPQPDRRAPNPDPIPDWIETVTNVVGALGFNKVRVRWKLQGWVNRRRAAARRREQALAHVKYEHRICRHCGAINDRAEQTCTRCGKHLGTRVVEALGRLGVHAPRALSLSSLVGVIIVAAYVRILVEHGGGLGLPIDALIAHGGSLPFDDNGGEWWRATTSVLLHAGLFHLAFNLFALASIAPHAEDQFGRGITLLLLVVAGTVASFGSELLGPPSVGVGASGGILGLIGAVAGAGHRSGTTAGRAVRDDMIKWVFYIFVFGLFIDADHHAHAIGLFAGAAFGLLVPIAPLTRPGARGLQVALGGVGLAALLAATVAVMVPLQDPPSRAGHAGIGGELDDAGGDAELVGEWPTDDPGDLDDVGTMLWLCSDRVGPGDYQMFGGEAGVREICASLEELRKTCREQPASAGATAIEKRTAMQCVTLRRLDGKWPPPRTSR